MKHAEVVIARQAVEEGRGLVVIVNKMDVLRGKKNSTLYEEVMKAVPEEIRTLIPQVFLSCKYPSCDIPFSSQASYGMAHYATSTTPFW